MFAIVALTTALGVIASSGKKKRAQVFDELFQFNDKLILNMKYSRLPIAKIAEEFKSVKGILNGENPLRGKDGEIIDDYVSSLGTTDAVSQAEFLNSRRTMLETLKVESADDYKKYSSLYIKIFFLAGALIAVLLA